MARGPMSEAAKKKIAAAQRRRWAAHRKAKAAGEAVPQMGPRRGKRRGRPVGSRNRPKGGRPAASTNSFLDMTVEALVAAKRQIDQAMARVRELLQGT